MSSELMCTININCREALGIFAFLFVPDTDTCWPWCFNHFPRDDSHINNPKEGCKSIMDYKLFFNCSMEQVLSTNVCYHPVTSTCYGSSLATSSLDLYFALWYTNYVSGTKQTGKWRKRCTPFCSRLVTVPNTYKVIAYVYNVYSQNIYTKSITVKSQSIASTCYTTLIDFVL